MIRYCLMIFNTTTICMPCAPVVNVKNLRCQLAQTIYRNNKDTLPWR